MNYFSLSFQYDWDLLEKLLDLDMLFMFVRDRSIKDFVTEDNSNDEEGRAETAGSSSIDKVQFFFFELVDLDRERANLKFEPYIKLVKSIINLVFEN